jgi:transcription initiation factor IIE alpha subunit
MTEQQVVEFVLVSENIPRQREFALKRLSPSDLAIAPVKKAMLELRQIKLADYRKRVERKTGRWRELYLRECESLESAIWELQNEQEAH